MLRYLYSIFSLRDSDSVMCGKFQVIPMQYDDFPNQQRYHREGPCDAVFILSRIQQHKRKW